MKNENKVYDEREMERQMDLSNFMYARLDGCFKRNDKKQYFISLFNPLIWPKNVLLFSQFSSEKFQELGDKQNWKEFEFILM